MDKSAHLLAGFVVALLFIIPMKFFFKWFELNIVNILIMFSIIYVYSLLADIDHKNSTITWTFLGISIVGILYSTMDYNKILMGVSLGLLILTYVVAQFVPHRGFTHSIIFGILVSLPWLFYNYEFAALSFLCFYSHLAGDDEWFKFI